MTYNDGMVRKLLILRSKKSFIPTGSLSVPAFSERLILPFLEVSRSVSLHRPPRRCLYRRDFQPVPDADMQGFSTARSAFVNLFAAWTDRIDPGPRYFCRLRGGVEGCYGVEREPAMRMSTRRRALGSQPGEAVVWKMPTRARTKSLGSVSERRSPLAMARSTEATKAL